MLAEEKENVQFIFADGENWKRKSTEVCVCVCMLFLMSQMLGAMLFNVGKEIVSNDVLETIDN